MINEIDKPHAEVEDLYTLFTTGNNDSQAVEALLNFEGISYRKLRVTFVDGSMNNPVLNTPDHLSLEGIDQIREGMKFMGGSRMDPNSDTYQYAVLENPRLILTLELLN